MTPVPDLGKATCRGSGRLAERNALITRGDSGVGGSVASAFARKFADVVIVHLPAEKEDAVHILGRVEKAGTKEHAIAADITHADRCRAPASEAVSAHGELEILVNNAGN